MLKLGLATLPLALGDGELFLSSSTSTPMITKVEPANTTVDCNPYDGQRYLIFGNGNGIQDTQCTASWDIHQIQFWDENGDRIIPTSASTSTGTSEHGSHGPWNVLDGDVTTFFAGDHDIGMSCDCWDSSKKDGQSIQIDLGGYKKVSKIMFLQGGSGNEWAISILRIHCGSVYQTNPLQLQISFGETDIECGPTHCETTRMDPAYVHTCDRAALTSSLSVLTLLLLSLWFS